MSDEQKHAGINPDPNQFTDAKKRLASDPGTNPETLDRLAQRDASEIAERVAENPQANAQVLEKLAEHDAPEVRSAVSENENTPDEIIESLAFDEHPDVRFRLAENPHAPVEVLKNLAGDENPYVAARAKETLESLKSVLEKADEHLVKEEFVEAEQLYKSLANELEILLGGQHLEVAEALHKLAAAVEGQGKREEALAIETRANNIQSAQEDK